MVDVMIGVDQAQAAALCDDAGPQRTRLRPITVWAGRRQLPEMLEWADGAAPPTRALESASGMGHLVSQQLVAAGETVLDVPATLASRVVRVLGIGPSAKSDPNDARSVAAAAPRAPSLARVRPAGHVTVRKLLSNRHSDLARWRNRLCCRLHALVASSRTVHSPSAAAATARVAPSRRW